MFALLGVMAAVVALYYGCPAAQPFFTRLAHAQQRGGVPMAALSYAFAGGFLAETTAVYFQYGGRWTRARLEDMSFRMVLFAVNGCIVCEFYRLQAFWFGDGPALSMVLPKLAVDQLIYTPFFSVPFQTTCTRWHALRYSVTALRSELNRIT